MIVSAFHDAREFIVRHLDSVRAQAYPRSLLRHVVVDDASRDGSVDEVDRWLASQPHAHSVELTRNERRLGGCANYTREFRRAAADSIVLQLDGDDWLADPGALRHLDRLYADPELWMTYNSWAFPDGRPSLNCAELPLEVVRTNSYRDYLWVTSHLHSFRAKLFRNVREESLFDAQTGDYFAAAVDMAHYMPMLELAGVHARHVERVLYVYNLHERSLIKAEREKQLGCELRIRALERYRPLEALV